MAEKILQTRIQLKYDTYTNWLTANPILKKGEMAVATISAPSSTQVVNSVTTPQVILKIGDGTTVYKNLPFTSALAADVYNWAKSSDVAIEAGTDGYNLVFKDGDRAIKTVALPKFLQAADLPTVNNGKFTVSGGDGLSGSGNMTANQAGDTTATIAHAIPKGAAAEAKGSEKARTYIKTVTTDKFGHVTGVTTGEEFVTDHNTKIKTGEVIFGQDAIVDFIAGDNITLTPDSANATLTVAGKDWTEDINKAVKGLSGAMHFKGKFDALPAVTDYAAGDVVIVDKKEYVLLDEKGTKSWVELGDESAYDVKGTAQNLIDALNAPTKGGSGKYIASIKQENGLITATEGTMPTIPTALKNPNALTFGTKTYDGSAAKEILASDLGALTKITTTANGGLKVTGNNNIDIDTAVTFVFDCGSATTVI